LSNSQVFRQATSLREWSRRPVAVFLLPLRTKSEGMER
jgi:hypothetical protein